MTFLVKWGNGSIRKLRLILKFRRPQPEKQTMTMYIFPNSSRSKGNQTKKIRSVNRIKRKKCFIQNSSKKDAGRELPGLFLFFEQALHKVKASGLHFSFNILHP